MMRDNQVRYATSISTNYKKYSIQKKKDKETDEKKESISSSL